MSALVLPGFSVRTFSRSFAQFLALALALAIPLSNSFTTIISLLLAIACILYMDGHTWGNVLKHPITIAILIFVSLNIIDMLYSIAASKELALGLRKASRLLYFPLLLPLFSQVKWRQYALLGFTAAILLSVAVALVKGSVYFKDTIFTSLFVAYTIFILAHASVDYKKFRYLAISAAIFLTAYLFFICLGRAGQLLFIMLFFLFAWQRIRFKARLLIPATALFVTIIALTLLLPSAFSARQKEVIDQVQGYLQNDQEASQRSSMGVRLTLATNTWQLIKQKPIFGWGTGAYRAAYAAMMPEAQNLAKSRTNPHNQYLLTWAELGLPGLFALLYLFYSAARFFAAYKQFEGFCGVGLVLAIAAGCCMNSWLLDFTSGFFFVYIAAVLSGAMFQSSTDDSTYQSR